MDDMVIIGAGECGTRAAFALREAGYSGPITLIGSEPHMPYERPPLSKPAEGRARLKAICDSEGLAAAGIDYLPGISALRLDADARVVTTSDGVERRFAKALLATGARPRRLACLGSEQALVLRTFADAERIFGGVRSGQPVAIIGAGLIGLELAAVLHRHGARVTVIEAGPHVLGRAVPAGMAEQLQARHLAEGVDIRLQQGLVGIEAGGITLADGSSVAADTVIAAVGVEAETGLASASGLAVSNGIAVDRQLRASAADIFAAGDCAALLQAAGGYVRFESWRNARAQAELAARNMAGGQEIFSAVPSFWSDQYDLGLQVVGLPDPKHEIITRRTQLGQVDFYLDSGRLVAAAGLGPGNSVAKDIRIAELLIAAETYPEAAVLEDPSANLKALLRKPTAAQGG